MLPPTSLRYKPIALQELEKAIASETNRLQRNILRAKRAAILIHCSELDAAQIELNSLRGENTGVDPRLSAWLIYCDGHAFYASSQDVRIALGRFRMAHIFATGLKDRELAGLSAAWICQCHFLEGQIEQVPEYLAKAFDWASPDYPGPLARSALILADTLAWSGDEDTARAWYHQARIYAASAGEISMQNSVIYNSAAFRVSNLNLAQIQGVENIKLAQLAETEVTSAAMLNTLTDNKNSPYLIHLLQAELSVCLGNWSRALLEFEQLFSTGNLDVRYTPKLLAERALCHAKTGAIEMAVEGLEISRKNLNSCCDMDDLAILHFRAHQTAEILGKPEVSTEHFAAAKFILAQFALQQKNIKSLIEPVITKIRVNATQTKKDPD